MPLCKVREGIAKEGGIGKGDAIMEPGAWRAMVVLLAMSANEATQRDFHAHIQYKSGLLIRTKKSFR